MAEHALGQRNRSADLAALIALTQPRQPAEVAVGGGLVTDEDSYGELRRQARTVWLRAAPEDHWRRVVAQGDTRPMADNEQAFVDLRRILSTREPLYERAEVVVDTSETELVAVVDRVADQLAMAAR